MEIYRSRHLRNLGLAVAIALLLLGCGQDKDVGSKELLEFEEQEAKRLGAVTTTVAPENPGTPQPPAAAAAPPETQRPATQAPPQTFFDVGLIASHPYFEPGDEIVITRGTTLRVTNKDTTPERPDRAFTAEDGTFDSGRLKPGQVWTMKFDSPGVWRIVDRAAPFIVGKLEVR